MTRRRLSLAHLSAITLPPPTLIEVAALAGFDAVGLRLLRVTPDSPGYPLMLDPVALRATQAALQATGIAVSDIEFVKITPDLDPAALLPLIATGAQLGARHLICAPYDAELSRLADRLEEISGHCAAHGLGAVLEFFPWTPVPDLQTCWQVVRDTSAGVLVDALHFDRSGSDLDLLRQIPAARLPFAHLCDAICAPSYDTEALLHTARVDRLPPGDGQIDLTAFLCALPADTPLGLEVPMARSPADLAMMRCLHAATLRVLRRAAPSAQGKR